jgi:hypothetical protein
LLQARQQRIDAGEVQGGVAPIELLQRLEAVPLDGAHHLVIQRRAGAGGAEGAVAHAPPGTAGDLRDLRGRQAARAAAVELREVREGHMVDVHVEAHADGVGRDQEVDFLVLVQLHLRVARAGAQAAHHHRAAAAPPPDQFGDRVDLRRAERDDGAARRQAHELDRAGIGQLRQAWPRLDLDARDQALHQGADRFRAEEHRLDQAAGMQQAFGEHMATIRIGAELDLIDGDELRRMVKRHRLHRAGEPPRIWWDDLFLTGDQRDVAHTLLQHHPVVILAGQEAQREADDPGRMGKHPLDRQMRLAGIGRAEDGLDPRLIAQHAPMLG